MEAQTTKESIGVLSFDLIRGEYTAEEAREILLYLLNKKINFHEIRIISDLERLGEINPESEIRIERLRKARESVRSFIKQAEGTHKLLKITSVTQMEIA